MARNTKIQKIANIWERTCNPLRGLTQTQIEQMLDNARLGNDIRLQLAFFEIERLMPLYHVCIQKRLAGVMNRHWEITQLDDSREAAEQKKLVEEKLREADTLNEDGLTEALRHLCMAVFRGRSAVKMFIDDGKLVFKKLQNWNFLAYAGKTYWNPDAEYFGLLGDGGIPPSITEIPKDEVCWLQSETPIDLPGMTIFLRQLVGEQQWSRFVEKSGIPQVLLSAPEGTPDSALAVWNNRAMQIFEGGSGTLPYGTGVNLLTEARGQDPFSQFVQHQMELISQMATGGTLLTLGGATGLGSDLASVQKQSFDELVNFDCKRLSNAVSGQIVRKIVARFLGREPLVRFTFVEQDDVNPGEYLDMAAKLHGLGVKIDVKKLKELTGLSFIDDSVQAEWTPPAETSGEWSPEEKAELKKELESE